MEKTLKIISPTEAREINPLGEYPKQRSVPFLADKETINKYLVGLEHKQNEWQAAEASLKTYRIIPQFTAGWSPSYNNPDGFGVSEDEVSEPILYDIGSTHLCKVNDEDLTAIIL